jgi:cell wall-associated NlpC family hydrolase
MKKPLAMNKNYAKEI